MIPILDFVKIVGNEKLGDAKVIVDATLGNGYDTLWLATMKKRDDAQIYGFDIQTEAISNTKRRLSENNVDLQNIHLIHDTHAHLDRYIVEEIDMILFNFGYLPGGDKSITTKTDSSLVAIEKGLEKLALHGLAILVTYPGHEEGAIEDTAVHHFVSGLPWKQYKVFTYQLLNNTKKPPIVYAIEKHSGGLK